MPKFLKRKGKITNLALPESENWKSDFKVDYHVFASSGIVRCIIVLGNGRHVLGRDAVDPSVFSEKEGKARAYQRAFVQINESMTAPLV